MADHGRGTEGQARKIRNAVKGEGDARKRLGSRIRARFAEIGLDEGVPELRGQPTRPATFAKPRETGLP
jgi:antitoxin FitA